RHAHQSEEVCLEQLARLLDARFFGGAEDRRAGIVDQNIDAASPLEDGRHTVANRLRIADVEANELDARMGAGVVANGSERPIAATGQQLGGCLSDARGNSGDQCYLHITLLEMITIIFNGKKNSTVAGEGLDVGRSRGGEK